MAHEVDNEEADPLAGVNWQPAFGIQVKSDITGIHKAGRRILKNLSSCQQAKISMKELGARESSSMARHVISTKESSLAKIDLDIENGKKRKSRPK